VALRAGEGGGAAKRSSTCNPKPNRGLQNHSLDQDYQHWLFENGQAINSDVQTRLIAAAKPHTC